MDQNSLSSDDPVEPAGVGRRFAWLLALLGLTIWQGWLTLQLFGPDAAWQRLLDDQPILSGSHPLHLYHGILGAAAFLDHGSLSCYDPAFQAGYPKTPVFDGGSRPAELFLGLIGGGYNPRAYKIGLAICCCLVPLVFALTARGVGLCPWAAILAGGLGMLVWWGGPCRELLDNGYLDLLLAALAALAQVGLLLQFHRTASVWAWLGMLLTGSLGWFAQPLLFPLVLVPVLLAFYYSVGMRHRFPWHLALLTGLVGAVGINTFWLIDWVGYWWLRVPLPIGQRILTHRTIGALWTSPVWGNPADRTLAILLASSALVGVFVYYFYDRTKPVARLLALGAGGLLTLAIAGASSEPLGRLGTPQLLVPALWFAVLPAIRAWQGALQLLAYLTGDMNRGIVVAFLFLAAIGWTVRDDLLPLTKRCHASEPFAIGLERRERDMVEAIKAHTTSEARILWEDRAETDRRSRWSALLPLWTERSFLGGLDPDVHMEHAYADLADGQLAGRPLAEWTDYELDAYCNRYNIGWVVCRSTVATARFDSRCKTGAAERTLALPLHGEIGTLFTLRRDYSYVLQGQARWLKADCRCILLGDVKSEDGKVVLSLHYQAGMKASPGHVIVERDPDPQDPIPFVRLRTFGPVTRVTLTWEE